MNTIINLYSMQDTEIPRFLEKYYDKNFVLENNLEWKKVYKNPIEMADIIGVFIENKEDFDINMWVSIDSGFFINVTKNNADQIIRYLFERFPY